MLVIANALTIETRQKLDLDKNRLSTASKADLRRNLPRLEAAIADFRRDLGFKASRSEIIDILEKVEASAEGKLLRLSKDWIEDLCTGYNKYFPIFDVLPSHAFIQIDPGKYSARHQISWYWLEATVFEDMCGLFNLAKDYHERGGSKSEIKVFHKTTLAIFRATVVTAFHFVEAYLNGLGFGFFAANRASIDQGTASILLDWDFEKDKPKYLSLRDKALQFPRIILGLKHPPLQESNCRELKYILEKAKQMRDAITHVSPRREFEFVESTQTSLFYGIAFEDVQTIVDYSIELVKKFEKRVYPNENRLFWLFNRSSSGYFPEEVFQ